MLRRILEVVFGLAAVVAITLAATRLTPVPLPRITEVEPPRDQRIVCLTPGSGTLYAQGDEALAVSMLDEEASERGTTVVEEVRDHPLTLRGVQPAGGVMSTAGASGFIGCQPPASSGIVQVADAELSELRIVNPDVTDAAVNLTLYGPDGEVLALGARGIVVAPHGSRTIALSVLAERDGPFGVAFDTSRGRVALMAVVTGGATTIPHQPAERHLIPGVAQGTPAQLVLSNPSTERAAAEVYVLGANARFQPSGGAGVSIPAGGSVLVDLSDGIAGEAAAIEVAADQAIGATVFGGTAGAMNPAEAGLSLRAFGPSGGSIQLSNPGENDVTATVAVTSTEDFPTETEVVVPAGTTVVHPLPGDDNVVVEVTSPTPVFGALTYAQNNSAAIPLNAAPEEESEALTAELVPTLR